MSEQQGSYQSPFRVEPPPDEPGDGAVIAYQRIGNGGDLLTYVSVKVAGKWYTTGKLAIQGASWSAVLAALKGSAVGKVRIATAWSDLDVPTTGASAEAAVDYSSTTPHVRGSNAVTRSIREWTGDSILASAEYGDAGPIGGAQ